jgi:hypothetical protein
MISTYLSGTFFISNCNVPLFDRLYFLSLKMTFLEALFWDFSTNDTFLSAMSLRRTSKDLNSSFLPSSFLLLRQNYLKILTKTSIPC